MLFGSIGGIWIICSGFFAIGAFIGILCSDEPKPFLLRLLFAMFCYAVIAIVLWSIGDLVFGRTLLFHKQLLDY